ncbi:MULTISPECIES: hypothetical protein [Pseudomonas]|uniref:hypothetical protein n=1 Tax=Pseudomonas TaxID=286 RepID=UPI0008A3C1A3|nr:MULTISPECIES: hypothetical protein [Pseudomonas]OFR56898.1 hypothetical protein HMPREF2886_01815 [Pseudomonas sp. HMSC066A08]RUE48106.1 hypothetical protein IPC1224_30335 [Pseudomonas aeruginosa]
MRDFIRFMTSKPQTFSDAVAQGWLWGLVVGVALITCVVAFGGTFGQRCAKVYEKDSPEWKSCTYRLKDGGNVHG